MARVLSRTVLTSGILNIAVGPDDTPFDVHIELICDCSPFFDNLLKHRFTEPQEKILPLPDVDPDIFTEFLNWAYRGQIFEGMLSPKWIDLCRLWVLADKLGARELQNLVVIQCGNKYIRFGNFVDKEAVEFVYNRTPVDSPLRRMVVDTWVLKSNPEVFAAVKGEMKAEFWEDCCLALMKNAAISGERRTLQSTADFKKLYSVVESLRNVWGERSHVPDDTPRPATQEQMDNRKLRSPRPRSSRASSEMRNSSGSPSNT
ncbi:hypothetical protein AOQ84DRAFT_222179 [Glonium stellatum]|uniref:BTB domain-containing protein n=1 Tax=Glonium stellatum TaxID=574774 RepID=A0A8E2JYB3_9PEZI|nr:hypothetical protein AOQ84DRAFT_222179 [Glonium stellatum]